MTKMTKAFPQAYLNEAPTYQYYVPMYAYSYFIVSRNVHEGRDRLKAYLKDLFNYKLDGVNFIVQNTLTAAEAIEHYKAKQQENLGQEEWVCD